MNASIVIGFVLLLLIWWNLSISVRIVKYLKSQNIDASLSEHGFFVKGRIFRYLPIYKKVTIEQEGKVGALYNQFYLSFAASVILFISGVLSV